MKKILEILVFLMMFVGMAVGGEFQITADSTDQINPSIGGSGRVAYQSRRPEIPNYDIWVSLIGGGNTQITDLIQNQTYPVISQSGDSVAYIGDTYGMYNVLVNSIASPGIASATWITMDGDERAAIAYSSGFFYWEQTNATQSIWRIDGATTTETRLTFDYGDQSQPSVDDTLLVYSNTWMYDKITVHRPGGINYDITPADGAYYREPDVWIDDVTGDIWVSYTRYDSSMPGVKCDIWLKNIVTDEVRQLTDDDHHQRNSVVGGGYVVWQDDAWGDWNVVAYHISTGMYYMITTNSGDQINPDIDHSASYIVWQDDRSGNWDIWGHDFVSLGVIEDRPERVSLSVYPNPFNGACQIDAPEVAEVTIHDLSGRPIAILPIGVTTWRPAENTPSGVYLIRASNGSEMTRQRVVYMK